MTIQYVLMRLCRFNDLVATESHGLFPGGRLIAGPHGEFGYLPVFATREEADAASDGGRYPVAELRGQDAPLDNNVATR